MQQLRSRGPEPRYGYGSLNAHDAGEAADDAEGSTGITAALRAWWRGAWQSVLRNAVFALAAVLFGFLVVFLALEATKLSNFVSGPGKAYDFIIVGAGPAGSVLARRLSDLEDVNVLLLEAGPPTQRALLQASAAAVPTASTSPTPSSSNLARNDITDTTIGGGGDGADTKFTRFDVPLLWPEVAKMEPYHWPRLRSLAGVLQAKGVGGCGIHNAMLYVRALPEDIRNWNVSGWTWEEVFQLYLELEDYLGADDGTRQFDESILSTHGFGGPIATSRPPRLDSLGDAFISACAAAGHPVSSDFNAHGQRKGAGFYDYAIRGGVRDSAAVAMLAPVYGSRPNLEIRTNTQVTRVLLDTDDSDHRPENGHTQGRPRSRAVGVEFTDANGVKRMERLGSIGQGLHRKHVRPMPRAVIVTAGAIHTPQLLMLSGLGPQEEVQKSGTDLRVELPVGKNLQDHPTIAMEFRISDKLAASFPSAFTIADQWQKYLAEAEAYQQARASAQHVDADADADTDADSDSSDSDSDSDSAEVNTGSSQGDVFVGSDPDKATARAKVSNARPTAALESDGVDSLSTSARDQTPGGHGTSHVEALAVDSIGDGSSTSTAAASAASAMARNAHGKKTQHPNDGPVNPEVYEFGVFASPGISAGAFLSSRFVEDPSVPDLQVTVFPQVMEPHVQLHLVNESSSLYSGNLLITLSLLQPEGRYRLTLNDTSPWAEPVVRADTQSSSDNAGSPAYLSDTDIARLVDGVQQLRAIFAMEPLTELTTGEMSPGPRVQSEAAVSDWVRDNYMPNSHWCGSAKMGNLGDPSAVLTPDLAVRGVNQLYVADSASIPRIPNGNVHSTVVMMAAKLAEQLRSRIIAYRNGQDDDTALGASAD